MYVRIDPKTGEQLGLEAHYNLVSLKLHKRKNIRRRMSLMSEIHWLMTRMQTRIDKDKK